MLSRKGIGRWHRATSRASSDTRRLNWDQGRRPDAFVLRLISPVRVEFLGVAQPVQGFLCTLLFVFGGRRNELQERYSNSDRTNIPRSPFDLDLVSSHSKIQLITTESTRSGNFVVTSGTSWTSWHQLAPVGTRRTRGHGTAVHSRR